ncbi:MAG: sterol desaturase family protein [Hyphomicrobiales bacterium]|nr:sterol desaturase family protein [Hyphomicrobiales bacterium]
MSTVGMTKAELLMASPRLFDNPVLDKLSRVHWTFPLIYLPIAGWLLWKGAAGLPTPGAIGAFVAGYLIWTLCEYVFHRWLFHTEFPGKFGARIHFLLHGVHHVHPSDPLRLVMPPLMSVPLMALAWIVTAALFPAPWSYAIAAGFLAGYVLYDEIHFHLHHRTPRTKVEQTLRRLHLLHHFRDPERGYGVSAPWWDYVFGTGYAQGDKPGERPL